MNTAASFAFVIFTVSLWIVESSPITSIEQPANSNGERKSGLRHFGDQIDDGDRFDNAGKIDNEDQFDDDDDQMHVGEEGRRKRSITRLRYKDCGKENRAIMFDQLSVKPIPIQIPGFLDLRIKANVTRKLPSMMDVKLILKKKYFGSQWMRIPCIEDYGSCRYKKLKTCILTQEVFGCPVHTGYHDIDQKFMIPEPEDSLFSLMLEGEYKAVVRARHPTTRKELACLVAHFSLKNRSIRSL